MSGGRWDVATFFETGILEIEKVIRTAERVSPIRFGTAIDFGCGVGRLSQALATRFERVIGIDIAESMIREAVRFNHFPDRCVYLHNIAPDIGALPDRSADFIYSSITLQHVIPRLAERYIREFFRLANPGGLVIFQLPSRPRSLALHWIKSAMPVAFANYLWRLRTGTSEAMESYFIPEKQISKLVERSNGSIVHVESNQDGPLGWQSRTYFCVRNGAPSATGGS